MKPILFNAEMVRAILEGRKTVTRRLVKKKYNNTDIEFFTNKYGTRLVEMQNDVPEPKYNPETKTASMHLRAYREIKQPYQVGDILYVRETWKLYEKRSAGGLGIKKIYGYKADENNANNPSEFYDGGWRPSIHMSKEATGIFLKVTDVRVERLQDITEDDAITEGLDPYKWECWEDNGWRPSFYDPDSGGHPIYRNGFMKLWDNIYEKQGYGWEANPWVFVIGFERIEKPEEKAL